MWSLLKIKTEEFIDNKIRGKNILINEEDVYYHELDSYKKYQNLGYLYFKEYLYVFIGIFISVIIVIINSIRIKDIVINGNYPINKKIKNDIYEYTHQLLGIRFLNTNLKELNIKIRSAYNMYEWISITKKGNIVYVNITKQPKYDDLSDDSNGGDILSKYDGVIKYYRIYQGLGNVCYNKSVKKGDLLVSGNVYDHLVNPKAIILAEIYQEYSITINKNRVLNEYSGKIKTVKEINFCNLKLKFKKNPFKFYDIKKEKRFSFLNFISYYDIHIYEKSDIISVYTFDEAYELAKSEILKDFTYNMVFEKEKILEYFIIGYEINDNYSFKILTKELKNIT